MKKFYESPELEAESLLLADMISVDFQLSLGEDQEITPDDGDF